jgi:hypothetical protein
LWSNWWSEDGEGKPNYSEKTPATVTNRLNYGTVFGAAVKNGQPSTPECLRYAMGQLYVYQRAKWLAATVCSVLAAGAEDLLDMQTVNIFGFPKNFTKKSN